VLTKYIDDFVVAITESKIGCSEMGCFWEWQRCVGASQVDQCRTAVGKPFFARD
jgi:hypothetical protein